MYVPYGSLHLVRGRAFTWCPFSGDVSAASRFFRAFFEPILGLSLVFFVLFLFCVAGCVFLFFGVFSPLFM